MGNGDRIGNGQGECYLEYRSHTVENEAKDNQ